MPFPLTLTTPDGATALTLTVPTQWADVSLGQFVALLAPAADDTRRQAEVLCSLEAGALDQLAADDVQYVANLLAFASVGSLPYGILLEAQQHMATHEGRAWLACGPYLLALYRVQLLYGKYSAEKVAACEAALLAAPVTESYADAAFFLSSYKAWQSGSGPTKPTTTSPKTPNSTRGMRSWLNGLGLSLGWMQPPAVTS
jgi:hypothetical protein